MKTLIAALLMLLSAPCHANRTVMEALAVSNNTVYIDTINARVGISTNSPQVSLDVAGVAQFGRGATKSTFTANGSLNMAAGATISAAAFTSTNLTVNYLQASSATILNGLTVSSLTLTNGNTFSVISAPNATGSGAGACFGCTTPATATGGFNMQIGDGSPASTALAGVNVRYAANANLQADNGTATALMQAINSTARFGARSSSELHIVTNNTPRFSIEPGGAITAITSFTVQATSFSVGGSNFVVAGATLTTAGPIVAAGVTGGAILSGAGTRFEWIPSSAALRAGSVNATEWDPASIGAKSVAFGDQNTASGLSSFAVGQQHSVTAQYGSISGGQQNTCSGSGCHVGGGNSNTASGGSGNVVGGGLSNGATTGSYNVVAGGESNTASSNDSTVGGGVLNSASGGQCTVAGGSHNTCNNTDSTVGGGHTNVSQGIGSTIPGGRNCQANGDYSFSVGDGAVTSGLGGETHIDYSNGSTYTNSVVRGHFDRHLGGFDVQAASFTVHGVGGGVLFSVDGSSANFTVPIYSSVSSHLNIEQKTLAQLAAITPAVGDLYSCSNCTLTYDLVIGTGTTAMGFREVGTNHGPQ